jgi:hypothetical protein
MGKIGKARQDARQWNWLLKWRGKALFVAN